jgi:uncharacterized protein
MKGSEARPSRRLFSPWVSASADSSSARALPVRTRDRYVEVKGLAEKEVTADLALWPLRYVTTGNDLSVAQAQITRSTHRIFGFLARHSIDTASVQLQALEVSDAFANRFPSERSGPRFVILPRDQAPGVNESNQLQKIVRVVSTVQYFLK